MTRLFTAAIIFFGAGLLAQTDAATGPNVLAPRAGIGAKYFSRDPLACTSKAEPQTGAITADMAQQYVTCASEFVQASGDMLYLTSNVQVSVGKPLTATQLGSLFAFTDADANSPVYPIRGSLERYQCSIPDGVKPDSFGMLPQDPPGRNCLLSHETNATGYCYRTSFEDWSCSMQDNNAQHSEHQPAPGYQGGGAVGMVAPAGNVGQQPANGKKGTVDWSQATKILPAVPSGMAPAPTAIAQKAVQGGAIQIGMQMFLSGNYPAAFAKFHSARQHILNDPLASLWEGIALEALGRSSGWDLLAGNTDPTFGVPANELMALSDWRRGDLHNAKIVLDTCIRFNPADTSCAHMKQGLESGAAAPAVSDWPTIVGLTKITKARSTVWKP